MKLKKVQKIPKKIKDFKNEKAVYKQIIKSKNEMDKFEKEKKKRERVKKERKIVKNSWFNWLINYIP